MTACIRSIATAVPAYSIEQQDAASALQSLRITERWLSALPGLYRKSGVKRRSSVLLLNEAGAPVDRQEFYAHASETPRGPTTRQRMEAYSQYAGPLLEQACKSAIDTSQISAAQITHLVTVSCTGFVTPGVDHWLIENLGLSQDVQRFNIGFMGCHGAINGMRVAAAIVEANPDAVVLVGAVELCTLHQQYSEDPQQLVANSLFADGAAAVVFCSGKSHATENCSEWRVHSSKSWMIPQTGEHMSWRVGDSGFEMQLSPEVPAIIQQQLREPVEQWLQSEGLEVETIELWAVHPGGPRILDAVTETFGLPADELKVSRDVLACHGNMSSPTILFILKQMTAQSPSARSCLLVAFGPGLHAELMLLTR